MNNILIVSEDSNFYWRIVLNLNKYDRVFHCRINPLEINKCLNENIHLIIIGIKFPSKDDWNRLKFFRELNTRIPKIILVDRSIQEEDINMCKQIKITDIININLFKNYYFSFFKTSIQNFKVQNSYSSDLYFYSELQRKNIVYLGNNTYFHTQEMWIKDDVSKRNLSEREFQLLDFFIKNEGKVIRKKEIIEVIWNGVAEENSVSVLISRLRKKLGKASGIIQGRKQGGYLFKIDFNQNSDYHEVHTEFALNYIK